VAKFEAGLVRYLVYVVFLGFDVNKYGCTMDHECSAYKD